VVPGEGVPVEGERRGPPASGRAGGLSRAGAARAARSAPVPRASHRAGPPGRGGPHPSTPGASTTNVAPSRTRPRGRGPEWSAGGPDAVGVVEHHQDGPAVEQLGVEGLPGNHRSRSPASPSWRDGGRGPGCARPLRYPTVPGAADWGGLVSPADGTPPVGPGTASSGAGPSMTSCAWTRSAVRRTFVDGRSTRTVAACSSASRRTSTSVPRHRAEQKLTPARSSTSARDPASSSLRAASSSSGAVSPSTSPTTSSTATPTGGRRVRRSNSSTTPRAADGEHRSVMALQPEDPLRTPHSWRRGRSYPRATVRAPAIPRQVGGQVCSVFGPCVRVLTGAVAGLVRAGWRGEPALRPPYRSSVSERSETEQAVATGFSCLGRDPLAPLACRVHLTPDGPGPPHVRCPVPGVSSQFGRQPAPSAPQLDVANCSRPPMSPPRRTVTPGAGPA
jgi:hypothetical protein